MDEKDFPKLKEFCRKHNINWKIENIGYVCNNTLVTFRFVKDGYDSVVRRYIINDEFTLMHAENRLIENLCEMDFDNPYLSIKKFNYSSKASSFINEIIGYERKKANNMKIKNVIFQDPATIVFWEDGTKTVVRAEGEIYDPEKGLAMAISRKALGNNRDYYNTFIHWIKKYRKDNVMWGDEYKDFLEKLAEVCKR